MKNCPICDLPIKPFETSTGGNFAFVNGDWSLVPKTKWSRFCEWCGIWKNETEQTVMMGPFKGGMTLKKMGLSADEVSVEEFERWLKLRSFQ